VGERRSGLLIDWGGVMTTNLFEAFGAFCAAEGLEPGAVRDAFMGDPQARSLLEDFECGRIDEASFEPGLAAILGVADHAGLVGRMFGGMRAEEDMFSAVAAFKRAGVRTGLLSNSWGANSYDRSRFAELFDVLVISGELGVRKPEQEIYEIAAGRMALEPEEIVFVDDLPGNLKPARDMGMATIHHTDPAATIARLEELLGVTAGA